MNSTLSKSTLVFCCFLVLLLSSSICAKSESNHFTLSRSPFSLHLDFYFAPFLFLPKIFSWASVCYSSKRCAPRKILSTLVSRLGVYQCTLHTCDDSREVATMCFIGRGRRKMGQHVAREKIQIACCKVEWIQFLAPAGPYKCHYFPWHNILPTPALNHWCSLQPHFRPPLPLVMVSFPHSSLSMPLPKEY